MMCNVHRLSLRVAFRKHGCRESISRKETTRSEPRLDELVLSRSWLAVRLYRCAILPTVTMFVFFFLRRGRYYPSHVLFNAIVGK